MSRLLTVAETTSFRRSAQALLTEEELNTLIDFLSDHPEAGDIIKDTGGIRKLRWARTGGGKSGGYRVIYYFHSEKMPLWMLTMYAKNEKEGLEAEERKILRQLVETLAKEALR